MSHEPKPPTHDQSADAGDDADWPYASLLIFGYFGRGTPAGRSLWRRTSAFVVLSVVCILGLRDGFQSAFPDLLWVLGLPGAVAGTWWAYTRYLSSLDELSRTIQLKAFAAAYGAAMTLVAVALVVAWIEPAPGIRWELLALPVLAEGARGVALAWVARKYR